MNSAGNVKGSGKDEATGFRQIAISDFGNNQRNYYLLEGFGSASLPPLESRGLILNSSNKDISYWLGILNKLDFESLNHGDKVVFSTTEDGTEIKSFVYLKNDGTIELNGDADFLVGYTKLQEGFEALKADYNAHIHTIPPNEVIISVSGGGGAPAVGVPNPAPIDLSATDTESSASVDASKKENLKCE